ELWRRMHLPISEQGKWLWYVVNGYFNYHAVPTNGRALHAFRNHVTDLWRRTLRRRSQKDRMTWDRMTQLVNDWLPKPSILLPWPLIVDEVLQSTRSRSRFLLEHDLFRNRYPPRIKSGAGFFGIMLYGLNSCRMRVRLSPGGSSVDSGAGSMCGSGSGPGSSG